MKKITLNLMLCASIFAMASCGDSQPDDAKEVAEEQNEAKFDDTNVEKDAEFVTDAANASMFEVETGKLAATNAADPMVKEFGAMMVTDHQKANEELMALATSKNISVPTALSEDKQKRLAELAEKKGKDFDKAYMDDMVDGHKKVVDMFEKEANNGKDADAKSWAAGKLPTLKQHLEMAENGKKALK